MEPERKQRGFEKVRTAAQFIGTQPEAVHLAQLHLHPSMQQALDALEQLKDGQWRTVEEIGNNLPSEKKVHAKS